MPLSSRIELVEPTRAHRALAVLLLTGPLLFLLTLDAWAVPRDREPKPRDGETALAEIRGILEETEALPPVKVPLQGKVARLTVDRMPRFSVRVMAKYRATYPSLAELDRRIKANPAQFRLVAAVRQTVRVLEKNANGFSDTLRGTGVPVSPLLKRKVFKDQAMLAVMIQHYQEALDHLTRAGTERAREPSPRWQANYDYVRARLLARLIYIHEYNLMLGLIRRNQLPPLQGGTGWRLEPTPRLQSTDRAVKQLLVDFRKTLHKIEQEHPGTPWAVLAKRDREMFLGLGWVPIK